MVMCTSATYDGMPHAPALVCGIYIREFVGQNQVALAIMCELSCDCDVLFREAPNKNLDRLAHVWCYNHWCSDWAGENRIVVLLTNCQEIAQDLVRAESQPIWCCPRNIALTHARKQHSDQSKAQSDAKAH